MKLTLQSAFGYAISMGGTVTACVLGETSEDLDTRIKLRAPANLCNSSLFVCSRRLQSVLRSEKKEREKPEPKLVPLAGDGYRAKA